MDKIGRRPKIRTKDEALRYIANVAADKRSHVTKDDCIAWLELKMTEIERLAQLGLAEKDAAVARARQELAGEILDWLNQDKLGWYTRGMMLSEFKEWLREKGV